MPEHEIAILTEACRARDRLDKLDALLSKKIDAWAQLVSLDIYGVTLELHIDDALAKANTTAGVLKNLLATLPDPVEKKPASQPKGTPLDELAQRRAGDGQTTRSRTASRRRK